jgi:plastocyanin
MRNVPNNLKFGVPMMMVSFVIFALLLWGGDELIRGKSEPAVVNGGDNAGVPGGPTTATIVAKNQTFDKRSITASAGAPLTVTLDNQDAGTLHNIAFYTTRAATTKLTPDSVITPPFEGVKSQTLTFTPSRAGSFFFRCDVHPDTMTGTLIVK